MTFIGFIAMIFVLNCKKGSRAASLVAALEAYVHRALRVGHSVGRFLAPSEFLRDKFVEFGWPAERFTVLPNFLPEMPPARTSPEEQGAYGLYLGTLLPFKGVRHAPAGAGPERTSSLPCAGRRREPRRTGAARR